jgi:hypothetical protein
MEESSIITLIGAIGYSHEVCFMREHFLFGPFACEPSICEHLSSFVVVLLLRQTNVHV